MGMEAQHATTVQVRAEALAHDIGIQPPGCAEFGDLFQKIVVRVKKETQSTGERIDIQPGGDGRFHVGNRVSERERDFLNGG